MYRENEILITGANGLVGKEFKKLYPGALFIYRNDFDLTKELDVKNMYYTHAPKCVIHLAAKVGGIIDNINHPADFYDDNVLMNTLMVKYAYKTKVERFIGILSSCIYPDVVEQYPIQIEDLHKGPPTKTNFSYGYAKRALAVQIDSYNKQYNTKYNYVIPCNLYGENDKFDETKSHFISSLLIKIKKASNNGENFISLFGDGTPLRQFMHAEDLAKVIKLMIEKKIYANINISVDENYSIDEMANIGLRATGNEFMQIKYIPNTPNGQYRKDVCTKKFKELFPDYKMIDLESGMKRVYNLL